MSDSNDIATQEILGKPLEGKEFEGALKSLKREFWSEVDPVYGWRKGTKHHFRPGTRHRRQGSAIPPFDEDDGISLRLQMLEQRELSQVVISGVIEPPEDILKKIVGTVTIVRIRETREFVLTVDKLKQYHDQLGRGYGRKRLCFPGGRRNPGERVSRNLTRELWEEIRVDGKNLRYVFVGYIPLISRMEDGFELDEHAMSALYFTEIPETMKRRLKKGREQAEIVFLPQETLLTLPNEEYDVVPNHANYLASLQLFAAHLL